MFLKNVSNDWRKQKYLNGLTSTFNQCETIGYTWVVRHNYIIIILKFNFNNIETIYVWEGCIGTD